MKFEICYEGRIIDECSDEDVEAHLDEVAGELMTLEEKDARLADSTVSAALAARIVVVTLAGEVDNIEDAAKLGGGAIRAAIHAADGATSGWTVEWCTTKASKADVPVVALI